ncbi:MAG: septum formation initiator family protein [Parvularculaceae bacterium]
MGAFGRFLFTVLLPALCVCWAAFLAFEAVAGAAGYRALAGLQGEARILQDEVEAMRARRLWLERRASLLHSRGLDADMADERIRAVLGYAREGDFVIPRDALKAVIEDAERPPEAE